MEKKIKILPRGYSDEDVARRRECLQEAGVDWHQHPIGKADYKGLIENHIGHIGLPMAVAGPALIHGSYANGLYHIPVAVLEGTLVMSMTRGLYAAAHSGGIQTVHLKQEISRSPMFRLKNIRRINDFVRWVDHHFAKLKCCAQQQTSYGKLLRIDTYPVGNHVILDCVYDTAEAAGQNMITIATKAVCKYVFEHARELFDIVDYKIESNFNGDKNISHRNLLLGRGHQVVAKTVIKRRIARRILNMSPRDFDFVDKSVCIGIGSILGGNSGQNLHVANGLAAIYLATGQDIACIVENAGAMMDCYINHDGDWEWSLTFRSMSVGTVGGATRLPQQKQNLAMMQCQGDNSSKKLAEIIAAACLGLEISLAAAVATREFSSAHAALGR